MHPRLNVWQVDQSNLEVFLIISSASQNRAVAWVCNIAGSSTFLICVVEAAIFDPWDLEKVGFLAISDAVIIFQLLVAFDAAEPEHYRVVKGAGAWETNLQFQPILTFEIYVRRRRFQDKAFTMLLGRNGCFGRDKVLIKTERLATSY